MLSIPVRDKNLFLGDQFKLTLRPFERHINLRTGFFVLWVKRLEDKTGHLSPSSAKVKNKGVYVLLPFHFMVHEQKGLTSSGY